MVLLANPAAALPLRPDARVAVIGPLADDPLAFFGCYSMPRHLGATAPRGGRRPAVAATVLAALRAGTARREIDYARRLRRPLGGPVRVRRGRRARPGGRRGGGRARRRGRAVRPGHLRRGLRRGRPAAARRAGRPAAGHGRLGHPGGAGAGHRAAVRDRPRWPASWPRIVQAFFPGEEGGGAIAGVLSGRLVPSGRLPVEMPASPGGQPSSYLRPRLAARHPGSSVDPTPLFAFGHGLSYTSFAYSDLVIDQPEIGTDGTAVISCTVRNTGARAGDEIVQLYLSDPVAQVVRPARWLAGLRPGAARARPGPPGHLPAARRPDRVPRPGLHRGPHGRAGRDPGRASAGPRTGCRCTGSFTPADPSARSAPAGCWTPRPRSPARLAGLSNACPGPPAPRPG